MLTLEILSKNPQLNTFTVQKQQSFVSKETVRVVMRLMQSDLGIRYVPSLSAVITIDLKRSDNTTLTKTCTSTFADDRSVIEFSLTDVESETVIGQNLVVKVVDGSSVQFAVLQYGLAKVIADGSC